MEFLNPLFPVLIPFKIATLSAGAAQSYPSSLDTLQNRLHYIVIEAFFATDAN